MASRRQDAGHAPASGHKTIDVRHICQPRPAADGKQKIIDRQGFLVVKKETGLSRREVFQTAYRSK